MSVLVHNTGMQNPWGSRVWVPAGMGTSPGSKYLL